MLQFACSGEMFSRSLWIYRVIWFFLKGFASGEGRRGFAGRHSGVPWKCRRWRDASVCRGTHAGRWVTAVPRGRPC